VHGDVGLDLLPVILVIANALAVRTDRQQVESYITVHSGVQFSHSYCPDCYEQHVKPQLDALDCEIDDSDGQTRA